MRYAQLATQLLALEQQLVALYAQRRSVTDPAALNGILNQIDTISAEVGEISAEIQALIHDGDVTAVDITAAHARNQQVPVDNTPAPPPPVASIYGVWVIPYPTTAHGYQLGDHIYDRPSDTEKGYNVSHASDGISENANFRHVGDVTE